MNSSIKPPFFECGRYRFPMTGRRRPLVMGILNVTPDSFSDGGRYSSLDTALTRAETMIGDGVDIIDIGGESSRPGAMTLSLEEELRRVMPVIYALRDCGKAISVDTYKPEVMREALKAGADMINDIFGFRGSESIDAVKDQDCGLCVMHMQGNPRTMQAAPQYDDVATNVMSFFQERLDQLGMSGIVRSRLCIDPGFGFGKTGGHNVVLLNQIKRFNEKTGVPVLAGLSRKAMIGAITGKPVEQRLAGSLAAALAATAKGASILRVHDVAETVDALAVWQAIHCETE
jgi:dihydropteroate synthase